MTKEVFIKAGTDEREYERKNQMRILGGRMTEEGLYAEVIDVSLGFFIDVWDCQGRVVLWGEQSDWSDNEYILPKNYEFDEEAEEALVNHVIYEDVGGAINSSGHYHPTSEKSRELFDAFMETVRRRA